jgi:hypothetical protein
MSVLMKLWISCWVCSLSSTGMLILLIPWSSSLYPQAENEHRAAKSRGALLELELPL